LLTILICLLSDIVHPGSGTVEPTVSHSLPASIHSSLIRRILFISKRHAFPWARLPAAKSNVADILRLQLHHSLATRCHHTTATPHTMAEQTLNIPQTLVFLIVVFLIFRWYFSKPTPGTTSATGPRASAPPPNRGVRINPAQIETIAQMFPQLSRRDIMWDLQRNGGNVTATTERVLSGRGLDAVSLAIQSPISRGFRADSYFLLRPKRRTNTNARGVCSLLQRSNPPLSSPRTQPPAPRHHPPNQYTQTS
jgi:hypothetical protein